jgi:isochorismate hydrolase
VIAELARRLSGTLGPTAKASTAIRTLAVKLGPCDAQVCGTFKSYKSFNRTKLQRNLNNIGVRSFILTGAPLRYAFDARYGRFYYAR